MSVTDGKRNKARDSSDHAFDAAVGDDLQTPDYRHAISGCALPGTPLARAAAGLDACVHCGFCLQACPTYVNIGDENESPRGRIVFMRRMLEGEITPDDPVVRHIDRCLGCRACETACPSGVPYGELLEATRATLGPTRALPLVIRLTLFLFSHHLLLRFSLACARLLRFSGLPRIAAPHLPSRLAFPMAMLASTAPSRILRGARKKSETAELAQRTTGAGTASTRGSVTMLDGCVMSGLYGHVNRATAQALTHNGYVLHRTPGQRCCGALHAHSGHLNGAKELARANIAAFEKSGAATVVVNSAGCGAMLKQYGQLLDDEPEWADRAASLSRRTRDASEILAEAGPRRGSLHLRLRVTHDPPCHQMHAQRIIAEPVQVLNAIDGLEMVPLEDADQCCGSAGIYSLVEPTTSAIVLEPKLAHIARTCASVLASGNPGCMMQLGAGLLLAGSKVTVVHPMELLAASYSPTVSGD